MANSECCVFRLGTIYNQISVAASWLQVDQEKIGMKCRKKIVIAIAICIVFFSCIISIKYPPTIYIILSYIVDPENIYLSFNGEMVTGEVFTPLLPLLAKNKDVRVRLRVAQQLNVPVKTLIKLANDSDARVRLAVVNHPHTPAAILDKLTHDPDKLVKASNIKTSAEILAQLATDTEENVRYQVAQNPSTPPKILKEMDYIYDIGIRYSITKNTKAPAEILIELAQNNHLWDEEYFHRPLRREVLSHHNIPIEILKKLASNDDDWVRIGIGYNPNTPTEILRQLADDKDKYVRLSVATNLNTSEAVLLKLAEDKNRGVKNRALESLRKRRIGVVWSYKVFIIAGIGLLFILIVIMLVTRQLRNLGTNGK